jgi:hypothetical protein
MMIALFTLAAMLAAAPEQASPAPATTPAADLIPEIGRVKSKAPACVALQDLVAPSFAAALRADKEFTVAAPDFGNYASAKSASTTRPTNVTRANGAPMKTRMVAADQDSATPEMYLARLDKALATMTGDLLAINKALGDPRLATDSSDPAVQSEREQMQRLYVVQASRIATLQEFLERERMNRARTDATLTDNGSLGKGGIGGQNSADDLAANAAAALDSGHVPLLFGQPMLNGLAANDKQSVNDWTSLMARSVHENENRAAKTFYDIAQTCK